MANLIVIMSVAGLIISLYAYYVGRRAESQKERKAICDISSRISCTKAFTSEYGKIAGVSNSLVGVIFYIAVLALVYYGQLSLIFYLAILSFVGSIYLAYLSYLRMKNFCLVCSAIYLVNVLLLVFSYLALY